MRGRLTAKWRGDRWKQRENSRHPPLIASTGLSPSRYAAVHHSITTVLTHPIVDRPEVLYGLNPSRCLFASCVLLSLHSVCVRVRVCVQMRQHPQMMCASLTFSHQLSVTAESLVGDIRAKRLCVRCAPRLRASLFLLTSETFSFEVSGRNYCTALEHNSNFLISPFPANCI